MAFSVSSQKHCNMNQMKYSPAFETAT